MRVPSMKVPFIFFYFLLAGCAAVDTGQIDYRIAERQPVPALERYKQGCETGKPLYPDATLQARLAGKKAEGSRKARPSGEPCMPLSPAHLVRKYASGGSAFAVKDKYSIDILQGNIGPKIIEALGTETRSGEILILANMFEFGSDASSAQRFLDSPDMTEEALKQNSNIKVIYFGDDVRRRQTMNFSNIPLQPISEWSGRPIAIQIIIIEVDTNSEAVETMLSTLAKFGESSNIIPAGTSVENVLLALGKSLLDGGAQDDILFEYRMVLHPAGAIHDAYFPIFEPGKYVLRRSQIRDADQIWSSLRLDFNTGRLFEVGKDGKSASEFRDDLYLTLDIKKYPSSTPTAAYAFRSSENLMTAIQNAAHLHDRPLAEVTKQITAILQQNRSVDYLAQLGAAWALAEQALMRYSDVLYTPDDNASCTLIDSDLLTTIRNREMFAAEIAVNAFHTRYAAAANAKANDSAQEEKFLLNNEYEQLVSTLGSYMSAAPDFESKSSKFGSPAAFEEAFIKNSAGFLSLAKEAAKANKTIRTCEYLINLGTAKAKVSS